MPFSHSFSGETYHGEFATREEAIADATHEALDLRNADKFWVGENIRPDSPETFWSAEDWLERVSCSEEYCHEWGDDWDVSTREQREELEAEVHKVIAAWLDRHALRPRFWNVVNVEEYRIADGRAELTRTYRGTLHN